MESAHLPRAREDRIPRTRARTNVPSNSSTCVTNGFPQTVFNTFIREALNSYKDKNNDTVPIRKRMKIGSGICPPCLTSHFKLFSNSLQPSPSQENETMDPTHCLASIFPKLTQLTFPKVLWPLSRDTLRALPVRFSGFSGYPPMWDPPPEGCTPPAIAITQPLPVDPPSGGALSLLQPCVGRLLTSYGALYL